MKNCIVVILLALVSVVALGCRQKGGNESGGDLPVIDVVGNLKSKSYRPVYLSELVSGLEYIPLESGGEFRAGSYPQIWVTADRIFVTDNQYNCYAFTREGKFVTRIGRVGRGPGEYTWISGISLDEESETIYLDAYFNLLAYSRDGQFLHAIPKPTSNPGEVVFLRDNLFLGYLKHYDSEQELETYQWVFFDDTGAVVKTLDSHLRINKGRFTSSLFAPATIASESLYLKEGINDTLFMLNRHDELVPEYLFDLGKYTFPRDRYIAFGSTEGREAVRISNNTSAPITILHDKILFTILVEVSGLTVPKGFTSQRVIPGSSSFMLSNEGQLFDTDDSGTVRGVYDMVSGKTELLDRDPVTRRDGLLNDLDGGLPFWPTGRTPGGELVQVWEAYEFKSVLTEAYLSDHPTHDPEERQKLRTLLKNLDDYDNPVVVIATLK